jgi:hypothetical protein
MIINPFCAFTESLLMTACWLLLLFTETKAIMNKQQQQ